MVNDIRAFDLIYVENMEIYIVGLAEICFSMIINCGSYGWYQIIESIQIILHTAAHHTEYTKY